MPQNGCFKGNGLVIREIGIKCQGIVSIAVLVVHHNSSLKKSVKRR